MCGCVEGGKWQVGKVELFHAESRNRSSVRVKEKTFPKEEWGSVRDTHAAHSLPALACVCVCV